jgi:membrane protein implicated in regulation of membrane protease activity
MFIPWWIWVIVAGALALAEIHAPGSYRIWLALGAAVTAFAHAAWGLTLEGQLACFTLASAVSCLAGFFVYRHLYGSRPADDMPLNQRELALIGARGMVCVAIANGAGKVRLGDSVWLARGPDLPEGTPVVVTALRGTAVIVEPLAAAAASEQVMRESPGSSVPG